MRRFIRDDGGRPSGLSPDYPDCTARAIAIATGQPYRAVARALLWMAGRDSFEDGTPHEVSREYMERLGWYWMRGDGEPLGRSLLPVGRLVVVVEPQRATDPLDHVAAVVDGAVRDLRDCRAGRVLGFYLSPV